MRSSKKDAKSSKKFYHKILALTFASLAILVAILTVISYIFIHNQVTANIESFESEKASRSFTQTSDFFQQIAQNAYYLSDMDYIPMEQLDANAKLWQKKIFLNNINALIKANEHISSIRYENTDFSIDTGNVLYNEPVLPAENYLGCDVSVTGSTAAPLLCFSYSSPQNNVNIYINITSLADIVLEQNSYIVNRDGVILISKNAEDISKNLFQKYKIDNTRLETQFTEATYKDGKYFISARKAKSSELYSVSVVSDKEYSSQYINIVTEVIGVGILFLLFVLGMVYYFVNRTYKPIHDIVNTFRYHLPNNVQDYEEEIAFINASIDKTITQNENLEKKLKENIVDLEHAQAEALHSQINPHFLLNTLENIKWMSVDAIGMDNEVENSLVLLNEIIVESMRQYEMLTSLRTEVRLAENYIALMQHRFKYPFKVEWNIDDDILECVTLKFTLQPLLENTLMHGFNQKRDDQKISVTIKSVDDGISILIADNGSGINPDVLSKIKEEIYDKSTAPQKYIGLKNLQLRIQLLFSDKYGIMRLDSDENGTVIEILIPKSNI